MKTLALVFLLIASLTCSCTSLSWKQTSVARAKEGLVCVPYEKDMRWDLVYGQLGSDPDIVDQSGAGPESRKYAMGYQKITVILNVEKQEIREGKTVRFPEVVTGLELCRKK